jgi:hypothetical protein
MAKTRYEAGGKDIMKLIQTADKFGNPGIKKQQFTHRHIYHYLPLDGTTSYDFFENVKTARPLFSNINENKLQVGEVMIIKELFFDVITEVGATNPPTLNNSVRFTAFGLDGLYNSQMSWLNDNNRVIKNLGLQEMNPFFNIHAWNDTLNVIKLKSEITMQPLITFVCHLNTPTYAAVAGAFIGCHALGIGTILAPKTTY